MNLRWIFAGTLRRQLSVSLILLVAGAVFAIGFASITIAQEVIRHHTARFGGKMLTQAAYRLGSVIDNAETTVDSLILDRRLAPLLQRLAGPDSRTSQAARTALRDLLIQYKASLLPGAELVVVDPAGNTVTTYLQQSILKKIIPARFANQSKAWRLRYLPDYQAHELTGSGRLLELTARIISLPGQAQSGWIILHLDYRIVESIMTNISLQENSLSRFQSDATVFGPEKQVIFPWIAPSDPVVASAYRKLAGRLRNTETLEETVDGRRHLVIATAVPWTPWEVYIAAPASRLYDGLEHLYDSLFIIGLICAVSAGGLAALISFFVTKPVHRLRKAMRLVEEGQFSARAPEGGPLEIQTLGRAFNRMLREVDRLTKRLVAEESERKTAVIKALQAQIAPHFLFNTLAALAGMTAKRPPGEVAEALRSLRRLLYLSIGKSGDFVPLAEEFEHIHHYLYLMNIRYPGRFSLQLQLPEELRHCQTLRLILQPIVENCLQHGLKSRSGLVQVVASREGDAVMIRVTDNGQGMSREELSAVWQRDHHRSGVGVRNVDARLKLSFGPDYGLALVSSPGEGTTALLRMPFREVGEPVRLDREQVDELPKERV
jgi:two-component system sensor histidine kinase YesM